MPISIVVNKSADMIKPDSNAMFVRVWDRGTNSCSRTDLHFKYLPCAKYLKTREELNVQLQHQQQTQAQQSKQKDPSNPKVNTPSSPSLSGKTQHGSKESAKSSPFGAVKSYVDKPLHKESNENGSKVSPFMPSPKESNGKPSVMFYWRKYFITIRCSRASNYLSFYNVFQYLKVFQFYVFPFNRVYG